MARLTAIDVGIRLQIIPNATCTTAAPEAYAYPLSTISTMRGGVATDSSPEALSCVIRR